MPARYLSRRVIVSGPARRVLPQIVTTFAQVRDARRNT
jgi:hypothetical protein